MKWEHTGLYYNHYQQFVEENVLIEKFTAKTCYYFYLELYLFTGSHARKPKYRNLSTDKLKSHRKNY